MSTTDSVETFVFYDYTPSLAAAAIFCSLFFIAAISHTAMMTIKKTWYFVPFLIGTLFEAVGYIGRALSSREAPDFTKIPYIMQSLLLLLGPTLMAATIYMILGRLVVVLDGENHTLIKPKWITKTFVAGDVLSFFTQSGGGAMLSSAKTQAALNRGNDVIIAGLVIQILFFGFFIVVAAMFHMHMHGNPTRRSQEIRAPWQGLLCALYIASTMIMIRSGYRVAEYAMGSDGVLQEKEYWLYIFDSVPMIVVTIVLLAFHPSRVVNRETINHKPLNFGGEYTRSGSAAAEEVPLHYTNRSL